MRIRHLLSAVALLAGSAVLVADSAGPTCELYKGWAVDATYVTDCGGGDEGAFYANTGDLSYGAVGSPQPEDVRFVQTHGDLTLAILAVSYDTSECDDASGQGTFTGLVLELLDRSGDSGMGGRPTWQCSGWNVDEPDQGLTCYPSAGGDTCSLQLTDTASG